MALYRRCIAVIAIAVGVVAVSLGAGAAPSRMLSDKKAHNGVAAAHAMPVQGIDVSYWQGKVADVIRDCSNLGGIILDPFGGSGTTIIAAERTKRKARLIEIEPHYMDCDHTAMGAADWSKGDSRVELVELRFPE